MLYAQVVNRLYVNTVNKEGNIRTPNYVYIERVNDSNDHDLALKATREQMIRYAPFVPLRKDHPALKSFNESQGSYYYDQYAVACVIAEGDYENALQKPW